MAKVKASIVASSLAHAAVLGLAVFGLPNAERLETPPVEMLPVDLVPLAEFTKLQKGDKTADAQNPPAVKKEDKPKPEPETKPAPAPKPKPKEATPPPPPPKAEPQPQPKPEPAPKPKAEPKPEPQPKPKEEPKPEPKPEPEKKAEPELPNFQPVSAPPRKPQRVQPQTAQTPDSQFSSDRVAALLNKLPDAGAPQQPTELSLPPGFGADRGADETLSQDEISFLRSQISRCWNPPVGVVNAAGLTVDIYFQLNPDGSVLGAPRVTRAPSDQLGQIAAESARRAVELCQPYALPPQKYDLWKEIELTFDPSSMLGR